MALERKTAKRTSVPSKGTDFLSVLQGAISTLNELKTDERNSLYINDDISRDYVILPNLQTSPRRKKSLESHSTQLTQKTRRRHSLMAPESTTKTTSQVSSATAIAIEAESPRTHFWNNPAPPSEDQLEFSHQTNNTFSLPQIKSTYTGSVISDVKTCFNFPEKNGGSRSTIITPLVKTRRCKSMIQSADTLSDIRSIQKRWNQKNITSPRHSQARRNRKKTSSWRIKIFERKQLL